MEKYLTPDTVHYFAVDVDIPNTDINKKYVGYDGCVEYCRRIVEIDWSGDNNKYEVAALSADTALVKEFFCSATNVATGRSAELTAYQEVRSAREGPHKLV